MRQLLFAAALMLAVAASASAQQTTLPPPTPEDVSEHVGAAQNGQSVELVDGGSLAIELQNSPSTGSHWLVASKPDFLTQDPGVNGPVLAPRADGRPMIGAPVWNVFLFEASGAGSGDVVLEKHGPGVAPGPLLQTFRIAVAVQ